MIETLLIATDGSDAAHVAERYGTALRLKPPVDSPEFPAYLQWFHYCEGMVMPPINTIMVHTVLLPPERRDEKVLGQAQRLLGRSLQPVNEALEGREYLAGEFSAADIMLGHACIMSGRLGMIGDDMPHLAAYVERLCGCGKPVQQSRRPHRSRHQIARAVRAASVEAIVGTFRAERALEAADPGIRTIRRQVHVAAFAAWLEQQHEGAPVWSSSEAGWLLHPIADR